MVPSRGAEGFARLPQDRPGTVPKRGQEEQGWRGEQGDGRAAAAVQPEVGRGRGLTRAPWEDCPCQNCHLGGCSRSSSESVCLSCGPGEGGTQVTVILPCRCSAPAALTLLPAAFPGTGKELRHVCFALTLSGCTKPKASPSMCALKMSRHPFLNSQVGFVASLLCLPCFKSMCWTTLCPQREACQFSKEDKLRFYWKHTPGRMST